MLRILILCVGKLKEKFYLDACAEYAKRLSGYCRLELVELPEERLPKNPSRAQIDAALAKEAAAIRAKLPQRCCITALCVEGGSCSSEAFSARLASWTAAGESTLAFLIGGSFGLDETLKRTCRERLSMSQMTFPHHLARVMLLEQLYRAFKIQEGSDYHK